MLLGGAIGDALGAAVEFKSLDEIHRAHGPDGITSYGVAYGRAGAWTDDTQMTLFTAEGLIESHRTGSDPAETIWAAYKRWHGTQVGADLAGTGLAAIAAMHARRAPGAACLKGCSADAPGTIGVPINDSKGCGGVMRVAPIGVVTAPFDLACAAAAMTHGHPSGWLSAGALAVMIRRLLDGAGRYAAVAHGIDSIRSQRRSEEVVALLERAIHPAGRARGGPKALEALGAGWVAEEALAIAVRCFLDSDDFTTAIVRAANHSGDSDSTASIAGQLFGAFAGIEAIEDRWLEDLEMTDVIDDLAGRLVEVEGT